MAEDESPIGILVVAHGDLAAGLIGAAEEILGPQEALRAVRIEPTAADPKRLLADTIGDLDGGAGVLALTDLFGGTPANLILALGAEHNVEVVTGANLPMLIRAMTHRGGAELQKLAAEVADYGHRQIMLPHQLLGEHSAT